MISCSKKEEEIKNLEYDKRGEREQVAVHADVVGFPSRRGRDVIGQDLAVSANQRLVRAAPPHPPQLSSLPSGCVENVFVINT